MALLFSDCFDFYATAQIPQWYAVTGSPTINASGRTGANCITLHQSTADLITPLNTVINSANTTFWAAAFFSTTLPGSTQTLIQLAYSYAPGGTSALKVNVTPSGAFQLADAGGPEFTSATGLFVAGVWQYVTAQYVYSTKTMSVYIGSVAAPVVTGVMPFGPGASQGLASDPYFGNAGMTNLLVDDAVIYDTTGASLNSFAGDIKILTQTVSAAGHETNWTPSSGANYTCVNGIPTQTTNFVSTSTVGTKDAYATTAPTGVPSVLALNAKAYAENSTAGARAFQIGVSNGTTDAFDSGHSLTTSYNGFVSPLTINPITSAAWTVANLTGLQLALNLSA